MKNCPYCHAIIDSKIKQLRLLKIEDAPINISEKSHSWRAEASRLGKGLFQSFWENGKLFIRRVK